VSKYYVNKLMLAIDRTDDAINAFKADPVGFIEAWEVAGAAPVPPYPGGGRLSPVERDAFEAWDYAALYAMGANPYVLWQVHRSLHIDVPGFELAAAFRTAVAPYGYPDFSTDEISKRGESDP